jgi:hypothetical protein
MSFVYAICGKKIVLGFFGSLQSSIVNFGLSWFGFRHLFSVTTPFSVSAAAAPG